MDATRAPFATGKMVPLARLERARLSTNDFESFASTIPPQGHGPVAGALAVAHGRFKRTYSSQPNLTPTRFIRTGVLLGHNSADGVWNGSRGIGGGAICCNPVVRCCAS